MPDAAIQLPFPNQSSNQNESNNQPIKKKIFNTHTEELVIGLCGPIGTNIHLVADCITEILSESYNYECITIKLSDLIRHQKNILDNSTSYSNKRNLIEKGNELRKEQGNDILAELAINEIAVNRERTKEEKGFVSNRVCYIIDSLKNQEELELFRLIYREIFYFIGVFSSVEMRVKKLEDEGWMLQEIYELIDRDSGEEMNFGQKMTDTFVESDFFLRIDTSSKNAIEAKLRRYMNLIFSSDIITPTSHETAMYLAYAAAGNSACLSRQVGAAITDKDGDFVSIGWNDVPKAGGSVYQNSSQYTNPNEDKRCMNLEDGLCFNDKEKHIISELLANELIKNGLVTEINKSKLVNIIKKSRIKELIEFSRAVHAEMLAIITGSQIAGDRIIDGRLYCTTYPCHNCARHIIASGIKEVYYIEPYRKSLALKLHSDSITEDEEKTDLVRILMFDGVSPRRYLEFYKMISPRKKDGKKIKSTFKTSWPKNTLSLQAIPILEKKVTEDLVSKNLIKAD